MNNFIFFAIDIALNPIQDTVNGFEWFVFIQMEPFLHLVRMITPFVYGILIQRNARYGTIFFFIYVMELIADCPIISRLNYAIMIILLNVLLGPVRMHRKPLMKQPEQIIKLEHIMDHSWHLDHVTKAYGYVP